MPALNILFNKNFNDIKDAVRRTTNDIDTSQVAIQEHTLSELTIAEFIAISHESGYDPRSATRPTSEASELSYALVPGDYFIPAESSADVIAVDGVWTNYSTEPLDFGPRHELEALINNDILTNGSVRRGIPYRWSMRWLQGTQSGNAAAVMQHQLLVYPAADRAMTVYWPRTIVDIATVDPSLTTGRPAFSYQLTYALIQKLSSMCIRMATDDSLARNQVDRKMADVLWQSYKEAVKREREERSQHVLRSHIVELMA